MKASPPQMSHSRGRTGPASVASSAPRSDGVIFSTSIGSAASRAANASASMTTSGGTSFTEPPEASGGNRLV